MTKKKYYKGVEVEVLPSGNCQGSTDWWVEDLYRAWWLYGCVGEGKRTEQKDSKRYLDILFSPSTKI